MTTSKILIGLCVFAVVSMAWCDLAAVEEDDTVKIVEKKVKFCECPVSVQKGLQLESVGTKINAVVEVTEDRIKTYKADVIFDAREYQIVVFADGTLLSKMLNNDEISTEIKFSNCPAAVQKTLKRESRKAGIEFVERLVSGARTEYIIDSIIEDKDYRIVVAENGILIQKKPGVGVRLIR